MADYELTIGPHPAQADDPIQPGKKLFKDGEPVSLLPNYRGIYFNGMCCAYAHADSGEPKVFFLHLGARLPESLQKECGELAAKEFGTSKGSELVVPTFVDPPEKLEINEDE